MLPLYALQEWAMAVAVAAARGLRIAYPPPAGGLPEVIERARQDFEAAMAAVR